MTKNELQKFNKLSSAAAKMLLNAQTAEWLGLVHTTGGGGPLKWWREVCKARKELEAARLAVFIGPWEGGYIVTHAAARKYGRKHLRESAKLYTMWEAFNGLSEDDPEGVTEAQLRKQIKLVRSLEKTSGTKVVDDWEIDFDHYRPNNKPEYLAALKTNHRPTYMLKFLRSN